MRSFIGALALGASAAALQAATPVPQGRLPDAAVPSAYRIDLTVLPDQPRFSGHVEIDVTVKEATRSLYLHGRDLKVGKAVALVAGRPVRATYAQVDPLGVARLDFAAPLPAGRATLVFDYDAPFGDGPSGLYRIKVGDQWYAWTQFESIDARAAYPGFDQPGYKVPFTVSITTRPGFAAVSNAPETGTAAAPGGLVKHRFAPTRPLPTYLTAFMAGPFAVKAGTAAPTPERAAPMPLRMVGTRPNADKMEFGLANSGEIVGLLEKYFGRPFPFPKLDQIGSPVMPGAMENAGADVYGDDIIMLDRGASTAQKQDFGMVVAHELAHQWFGDLVTPAWWDDIWLNESFANWMGYRIGNEWRPDLKIGAGAISEAFRAMNTDALAAGRPIHQPIATSGEIDSAFDAVTYGKGGQVVAMIAAYMGDDTFRQGVRLHLDRHAYGNATSEQFFQALADAGHDPRILKALDSFVNQQGVPLVSVARQGGRMTLTQKRYALYGSTLSPVSWTIPVCYSVAGKRDCTLLDGASASVAVPAGGLLLPNAGGTGYYRFALSVADWKAMIAAAPTLSPGDALAANDSLWAGFRAGDLPFALLVDNARAMAANPYSTAATESGGRLAGYRVRGLIAPRDVPAYRRTVGAIYAPRLAALGSDVRAGAYAGDDPDRQKLRSTLIDEVAGEAQDTALVAKLAAAARAWLDGDKTALDQSLYAAGFAAAVTSGGMPAAQALFDKALDSDETLFRSAALAAVAGSGDAAIAGWVAGRLDDPRMRLNEKLSAIADMMGEPATRALGYAELNRRFDSFAKGNGVFTVAGLVGLPAYFCSVEDAERARRDIQPKIDRYKVGALPFARAIEQARNCGLLRQARGGEIAAAFR